jgi:hypothetical protein
MFKEKETTLLNSFQKEKLFYTILCFGDRKMINRQLFLFSLLFP